MINATQELNRQVNQILFNKYTYEKIQQIPKKYINVISTNLVPDKLTKYLNTKQYKNLIKKRTLDFTLNLNFEKLTTI